jgi:predicted nucleotide-binding protein (sugar kinase/HSP70/actin superfamily)
MTDNLLAAAKTALEEVRDILEGFKSFMMVLGIDSWHYFPGCPAFEARIEAIRAAIKAAEAKLVAAKPEPFYEPPAGVDAEEVRLLKELERIVRTNSPRPTASALEALDAHRRAAGKEGT